MPNNDYDEESLEKYRKILDGEWELPPLDRADEEAFLAFHILFGKALEAEDYDEARNLIKKANGIVLDEEKTLTEKIREWISLSEGAFHLGWLDKELGIVSEKDKNNRNQAIYQLKKEQLIESVGNKQGYYRLMVRDLKEIDFVNAPTKPLDLKWPLFEEPCPKFNIYSSNICIIAGVWQAGKSAYLIAFSKLNMDKYKINFYSSEMGNSELKIRLLQHDDIQLNEWKIKAYERMDFYHDVIEPNAISIIDYIDAGDSAFEINNILKKIDAKLKGSKGICVCGLQKPAGRDLGYGKDYSAWVPRLYLSLENGVMKIVKAKNFYGEENPNGMMCNFRLYRGARFERKGLWSREL